MAQSISTFDPALKEHYVGDTVYDLIYEDRPAFAEITKNPRAGGKSGKIVQPVKFQYPGGGSATFTNAKANATEGKYEDFTLTRRKNYHFAYIENEVIEASMGDENAFTSAMDEIDDAMKGAAARLARMLPRSTGGAIGRIQAGTVLAGTVATLDDPADVFNFHVGMKCTFAAANGTGVERDSGDTLTVAGLDREQGEVTFTTALTNIAAIADTDFIFQQGDFGVCHLGVEDWLPIDRTVLSTSFNGVTRSQDADRLGGLIRVAEGEPLHETLIKGVATGRKHGARFTRAYANPETISDLMLLLDGKIVMNRTEVKVGQVGFSAVECMVGNTRIVLMDELSWPTNRMLLADWKTWMFHSAGESPKFLDKDSLLLRASDADSWEVRIGGYGTFGCRAPGHNMNCDLSAV